LHENPNGHNNAITVSICIDEINGMPTGISVGHEFIENCV